MIGPPNSRLTKITHLLFVDDLKTYTMNLRSALKQLDLITEFTNDIGMGFGGEKCAYLNIERGQRKPLKRDLIMNGLVLKELAEDDSYKYLGRDEDVSYVGKLDKEQVTNEYFRRTRKIWNSELHSKNKVNAQNTFAIPVLTPTFGILEWTKEEILNIDIRTRKLMTSTGNFHRNSSVDRLYTTREEGGRGLNSVYDVYICRLLSLVEHLYLQRDQNKYLDLVRKHEQDRLVRASDELLTSIGIDETRVKETSKIASIAKVALKENRLASCTEKIQHGFVSRKQKAFPDYNKHLSNLWLKRSSLISHSEGYIFAIQEQEIKTRALQAKREHPNDPSFNKKCRHCLSKTEDLFHILASCSSLSSSLYLHVRHNEVAKILYNALIKQSHPDMEYVLPIPIWVSDKIEIWWDEVVKTVPMVKHCKPDILLWKKSPKKCFAIDICVPLDENVHTQEKTKRDNYTQLLVGLNRLYPEYSFSTIPIVLGATGLVTNSLVSCLEELAISKRTAVDLIAKMQEKALIGSMRIVKSALSLKK